MIYGVPPPYCSVPFMVWPPPLLLWYADIQKPNRLHCATVALCVRFYTDSVLHDGRVCLPPPPPVQCAVGYVKYVFSDILPAGRVCLPPVQCAVVTLRLCQVCLQWCIARCITMCSLNILLVYNVLKKTVLVLWMFGKEHNSSEKWAIY